MTDVQVQRRSVVRWTAGQAERLDDAIAVEGPLEIRVGGRSLAVTLRTPGHDEELALGFLAGEGVIAAPGDVVRRTLVPASCADQPDAIDLEFAPHVNLDWTRMERHFAATAACGLCGRAHLDALRAGLRALPIGRTFAPGELSAIPERLREAQRAFAETGGLHAAAYCDAALSVQVVREDVGRHNAVDKIAGWLLACGGYPVADGLLWVSGRAGAEIVLKAARAGIPVLVAVGAPSTLAIEIAERARLTLVGFARGERMNVYTGFERVVG